MNEPMEYAGSQHATLTIRSKAVFPRYAALIGCGPISDIAVPPVHWAFALENDEILNWLWHTNKQRHEHERLREHPSELQPKKIFKGIPPEADITAQQGLSYGRESGRIAKLRPMEPVVHKVISDRQGKKRGARYQMAVS
jgi:hypothetical protein